MIHLAFHPLCATFPFPIYCCAAIFELLVLRGQVELSRAVSWLLLLGAVGVTCAFATGWFASYSANQSFVVSESALALHYQVAKVTLGMAWLVPAFRYIKKHAQRCFWLFRGLYVLVFVFVLLLSAVTGYFGARLVFVEGAGVVAQSFENT
jgi:uncharacterized membrane protein